ncbi:hypothetical protein ES702_01927 [subsurface metagenome]
MALEFNGSTQYVDIDQAYTNDKFTLTLWTIPGVDGADQINWAKVIIGMDAGADKSCFYLQVDNVGNWRGGFYGGDAAYHEKDSGVVSVANTLYFLGLTYDEANLYMYVNESQKAPIAIATTVENAVGISLGAFGDAGSQYYNGKTFDARIYNDVALSLAEMNTIYHARGADNIVAGLVARWLMNEKPDGETASGANVITDISGQGNHGSPVNSPVYRAAPVRLVKALT